MKKKIKIAHLYYDLMNLYGESANIRAIKMFIERQDVEAEIHFVTIGDKMNFKSYDFVYIGAGSDENFKIVLDDLLKYRDDIKEAIENGKTYIATGNAMDLFGKKIRLLDGTDIKCLDIIDYQSYELERRSISEIAYKYSKLPDGQNIILGFKNTSTSIAHNKNRMCEFINTSNVKNFYAVNFIGPLLIRNPYFTNKIVKDIFEQKGYEFKEITDTIEFTAYHEFLNKSLIKED